VRINGGYFVWGLERTTVVVLGSKHQSWLSRMLVVQILAEAGIDPTSFKQENQSRPYEGA
jgi:hypothetical protein